MPATLNLTDRIYHTGFDNPTGSGSVQAEKTETLSEKGTISMSLVNETLALARAGGLDAASLAEAAGIAPATLLAPHARVSAAQYGHLWSGIARALDDEFFGQDSHAMKSGSFIAMTHSALGAHTGRQALQRAVHFMRLVLDDLAAEIDVDATRVRVTLVHRAGKPTPTMFAYATWFILVYGLVCWLVGRRIPLFAARFRCPPPSAAHEYQLMFCDDMAFDQPATWFELAPAFLDLPVIQTAGSARTFLRNAPGNFVVKYRNPGAFAARVRRTLRALPATAWPDADAIAQRLNVAPATLRRRLRQEGHSCQSIKDGLRRDLAIEALRDPALSVADVAAAVGFAEPSAFHRAFRKWTGQRPTDYRAAHLRARTH
ncbi:AraC family transcriptional regulator [Paraburkholderia unamae]|uniref:AraC family transcriptional regulator n=1 Tax=Paraburkholderia unamae TaxID=219649 RepID=A0ABX5KK91_9BURK|nr:AraC family transcriptional regulator [Paraburkholderia unamae]PVX78740.1 AraC family transcriptional regulator [Paraburkholderia unamae]